MGNVEENMMKVMSLMLSEPDLFRDYSNLDADPEKNNKVNELYASEEADNMSPEELLEKVKSIMYPEANLDQEMGENALDPEMEEKLAEFGDSKNLNRYQKLEVLEVAKNNPLTEEEIKKAADGKMHPMAISIAKSLYPNINVDEFIKDAQIGCDNKRQNKNKEQDADVAAQFPSIDDVSTLMVKIAAMLKTPHDSKAEEINGFNVKKEEDVRALHATLTEMYTDSIKSMINEWNDMGLAGRMIMNWSAIIANDSLYAYDGTMSADDVLNVYRIGRTPKEHLGSQYTPSLSSSEIFFDEIIPAAKEYRENRNHAVAEALFHFTKDIDGDKWSSRSKEEKEGFEAHIKAHPKETLALFLIDAQTKEEKGENAGVKIYNLADFKAKTSSPEVQKVAEKIDYNHLPESLSKEGEKVHSCDLTRRQGLGPESNMNNNNLINNAKEIS